jgi:uncharacterized membrane protein YhaH (DUF805 family)
MPLFQTLYDAGPNGHWVFLLVTVIMGGCTAYVSGKAIAETWRPAWHAIAYALIIGLAARFIHFALFEEVMLSGRNYLIDCIVLIAAAAVGYLVTRRRQMLAQYGSLQDSARS